MKPKHVNPNAPKRVPLRYMGGKFRIREWAISHFVDHSIYVEPFGGGASVLLGKRPSSVEVYNDRWDLVVNFFKVLRDDYDELARLIALTPYSRSELQFARDGLLSPVISDVERARRFMVWNRQSYNYMDSVMENARYKLAHHVSRPKLNGAKSWRPGSTTLCLPYDKTRPLRNRGEAWRIENDLYAVAQRFQNVCIENKDAIPLIAQYDQPNSLFYLDPPYPGGTREAGEYVHEMTDEDHVALLTQLQAIDGYALISTYPNELYSDMLTDWTLATKQNHTKANKPKSEALYISRRTQDALDNEQPRLF